jgi:hypothetical protein
MQRGDEHAEVRGQPIRVGEAVRDREFAVAPAAHAPGPRIPRPGNTGGEDLGNGERKQRAEKWQPAPFLLHVTGALRDAGEAYGHVVAEPVQGVDGPGRRDAFEWQLGPARELCDEQLPYERVVDRRFMGIHRACGHQRLLSVSKVNFRHPRAVSSLFAMPGNPAATLFVLIGNGRAARRPY